MTVQIGEIAAIVRSKTAGPFELTLDVIFPDKATFERVKRCGALNAARIADAYDVDLDAVLSAAFFEPALAFKATLARPVSSGSVGDTDVYGAQQHVPLLNLTLSLDQ